jgi:epoxyqueuosine reductase
MEREQRVLELAHAAGFDLAGLAPLRPPRDAARLAAWLDAGHHGSLDYLERFRPLALDPRRLDVAGRTLLVVGLAHSRPAAHLADGARVARYAAGRDYHNRVVKGLRKVARQLEREGLSGRGRAYADAAPLLERSHAAEAGLGFASKAANLLHPAFGPWFFLGELVLDVELTPTTAPELGSCGTCTACIDACPTGAILEPGLVDAPRCISYQTIENRGAVPHELRTDLGGWVFGCDVCSEVCPWGAKAPDRSGDWGAHPGLADADLVSLLETTRAEHPLRWNGSPLRRPGRAGLARNAALALGQLPSDAGRRALLRVLDDDASALVREAAAWALARGHGDDRGTLGSIERALAREPDAAARDGIRRTLAESR